MASITLKNIPDSLHAAYKRRAKLHSRSLQEEILQTWDRAVSVAEEGYQLSVDEVAGMLKPGCKGVSVTEMDAGISRYLKESWK